MMVETEPMEVRVISPTRRRADKSTGPPPPFLGYSQQPRALESLLSAQMGLEATDKGMESLVKNNPGHIGDLKRIEKNLQLALGAQSTLAVTADGRPASARGATRRRPPSANSRAKPLQQVQGRGFACHAGEGPLADPLTCSPPPAGLLGVGC